MVHLRFLGIFIQYLFVSLAGAYPWKVCTALENFWVEHFDQCFLPSRCHWRGLFKRLDRSSICIGNWRFSTRSGWVPHGRFVLGTQYSSPCWRLRRSLWVRFLPNLGNYTNILSIFLSLGEAGPGDNIGLVASKTSATAIRGQYYAIAAAMGKIGAFVGTYIFPIIQDNAPGGADGVRGGQDPFFVSSSLCIFSAFLAFFLLPHIGQDTITEEDIKFRAYLEANGWDTRQMGVKEYQTASSETINSGLNKDVVV